MASSPSHLPQTTETLTARDSDTTLAESLLQHLSLSDDDDVCMCGCLSDSTEHDEIAQLELNISAMTDRGDLIRHKFCPSIKLIKPPATHITPFSTAVSELHAAIEKTELESTPIPNPLSDPLRKLAEEMNLVRLQKMSKERYKRKFGSPKPKPTNLPAAIARLLTRHITSDVEKYQILAYWIYLNVHYEKIPTEAHRTYTEQNPEIVIRKRRSMCFGYSLLYKKLCNSIGLHCKVVNGYAEDIRGGLEGHAWNMIKLPDLCGEKYVDVTFAANNKVPPGSKDRKPYKEDWISRSHAEITRTHTDMGSEEGRIWEDVFRTREIQIKFSYCFRWQ
ncbi:hypothetical protein BJ508DRAFT_332186 [Ascobolus immersus RN42]|uniref:Transglutaminase-like domain-containing protein n=1 Tax=Ascobolus immersus RN42 TaxID=1160509 RepID=A0A3N4HPY9_ASCIM|nr:hypothetical protein BJ508DRAFT_332186 [Ascobolus immersus RN42]